MVRAIWWPQVAPLGVCDDAQRGGGGGSKCDPGLHPPARGDPGIHPPSAGNPDTSPPATGDPVMRPPARGDPGLHPPATGDPVFGRPATCDPDLWWPVGNLQVGFCNQHLCNTLLDQPLLPAGLRLLLRAVRTVVRHTAGSTGKVPAKGNPGLRVRRPRQRAILFPPRHCR